MTQRDPFLRAMDRLGKSRAGEKVKLRGKDTRALVERGTSQLGDVGQVIAYRTIVQFPSYLDPQEDDSVILQDGTYVVDAVLEDDGYWAKVVLREA